MNNPNNSFIRNIWSDMGKPFRNKLIRLNNVYSYSIKKESNPFKDMKELIQKDNPVIVDGGANNGGTITSIKQYIPNATIIAFEPLESLGLKENVKEFDNVHIEHLALGEKNKEIMFNEMNYPDTSSVFVHSKSNILQYLKVKEKRKTNMVSLDSWADKNYFKEIDIIKLDLQGYELNALKGAENLLKTSVKVVYAECSFQEFYVGQPLFLDVCNYITSVGFKIWHIYNHNSRGPLGYVDVMFIR